MKVLKSVCDFCGTEEDVKGFDINIPSVRICAEDDSYKASEIDVCFKCALRLLQKYHQQTSIMPKDIYDKKYYG